MHHSCCLCPVKNVSPCRELSFLVKEFIVGLLIASIYTVIEISKRHFPLYFPDHPSRLYGISKGYKYIDQFAYILVFLATKCREKFSTASSVYSSFRCVKIKKEKKRKGKKKEMKKRTGTNQMKAFFFSCLCFGILHS